jgi:hypothetical protein
VEGVGQRGGSSPAARAVDVSEARRGASRAAARRATSRRDRGQAAASCASAGCARRSTRSRKTCFPSRGRAMTLRARRRVSRAICSASVVRRRRVPVGKPFRGRHGVESIRAARGRRYAALISGILYFEEPCGAATRRSRLLVAHDRLADRRLVRELVLGGFASASRRCSTRRSASRPRRAA